MLKESPQLIVGIDRQAKEGQEKLGPIVSRRNLARDLSGGSRKERKVNEKGKGKR